MEWWIKMRKEEGAALRLWVYSLVIGAVACSAVIFVAQSKGLDPARLTGDATGYVLLAQNILEHQVFSFSRQEPLVPDSFRAPGYPLFLAGLFSIFHSWIAVLIAQALLVSAAPVLLYILLRPYHERAAWWGSILFAFEPVRLFTSSTLLSDALFTCLSLGSLVLLSAAAARRSLWRVAGAGLVLGLAILVRPIAQFLPLLFVGYLFVAQVPWRRAAYMSTVLLVACAVVVVPWMARNHALFGSWSISSVSSYNLAAYNAPEYAKYRPTPEGTQILKDFAQRQASMPGEEGLSLLRAEEFKTVFWGVVRGHELDYALFHVFKTTPFFLTDGLRDTVRLFGVDVGALPNITSAILGGKAEVLIQSFRQGGLGLVLLVFGSSAWLCVFLLYVYWAYRAVRMRLYPLVFLLVALVFYFALFTGPVSHPRYRLPVEGFLLVAAAGTVLELKSRLLKYTKITQN